MRTTTKTINDDLPILRLPATNAVAATNGEAYLDYNQVNDLLTGYTTNTEAICLYGAEEFMNGNAGSAAPLYIDQEATLKQSGSKGAITAHTSQMMNTYEGEGKERWHHLSSPLQETDFDERTLILTMSMDQQEKIYSEFKNPVNVFALRAYIGADDDVFDPYGGTLEDYQKCYEQLSRMLDRLSDLLLQEEKSYV